MASISIVLPGFPVHPVGGYKVVYQYSNYLAAQGHKINVIHMRPSHLRNPRTSRSRRMIRRAQYVIGRRMRPRWFSLDSRVSVMNYGDQLSSNIPVSNVIVATAAETADLVAEAAALQSAQGLYFIQHYENWLEGIDFVNRTWKLPLRKIVIAPWLVDVGRELNVSTALVPNAIDSAEFPLGPPTSERPHQLLAMVSDVPWKRSDVVAELMALIADLRPDVRLRTFGTIERPDYLPASVVHIHRPTRAELSTLYQESRVFVCASDAEGYGLPPAEAFSSGCAVVSTDIGGVRSYAEETALFSPVGDATALATNALRLLDAVEECQERAAAGAASLRAYTPQQAAVLFEQQLLG